MPACLAVGARSAEAAQACEASRGYSIPSLALQVQSGLVEYQKLEGNETDRKPQLWIYDECLRRYGEQHTWMGFTDADE